MTLCYKGLRFEVVPSKFKETLSKASFPSPYAYAIETAKQKALEVAHRLHQKDLRTPDVVIGADTIVAVDGLVLEKPVDKQDAYHMLSRLSGKEHSVFTGVAIVHCTTADRLLETQVSEFYEETRVTFSELSEDLLWEYIHSGEPMDKAGGYGIQSLGGMLVESVRGDFLNVVGFPLNRFCKQLAELYYPPRGQDVRRVKHDSIPPVDSFETLGDLDASDPGPVQSHVDPGAGPASPGSLRGVSEAEGDPPARGSSEASCNGAVEAQPPFPAGLLDLIDGFKVSKALFTACRLKVFDLLSDGAPRGAADVARAVDASVCGTRRLLEVCVALGLLRKTEQGYSNTELAGRHLVSGSARSLHGLILHSDQRTWDLFSHLERTLREGPRPHRGAPRGQDGQPGDQVGPPCRETQLQALKAVHTLSSLTARRLASAFDLSRFSSACLLGGCRGALAWELARECPRLEVTVLDVPDELEQVSCFQPQGGPTARVSLVPGDTSRERWSCGGTRLTLQGKPVGTWEAAGSLVRAPAAVTTSGCPCSEVPGVDGGRPVLPDRPCPRSGHHVHGDRGLLEEDLQGRGRQGLLQGRLVQRPAGHGRRLRAGALRRAQEGHLGQSVAGAARRGPEGGSTLRWGPWTFQKFPSVLARVSVGAGR
ncbi:probable bifunctional dTTP/UTP pyrophosphatase/methyltransferase protein isoform X2 [Marmota marmota marmota]|uniref:probable bifunctional dTTP/UTP pyrophosphatase/methyltransferase protein isoform X2 n=1 Tax=Marmota marmota marmota TaxID=9994 RepID=UPI002092BD79|nr:probable bifunctional dTTP/UTP pyrophosphatase/methyltransferase protein isoform X2 [Marmota marmota marmota]